MRYVSSGPCLLLLFQCFLSVLAFTPSCKLHKNRSPSLAFRRQIVYLYSTNNDNQDRSSDEGQELAAEFYKLIRQQEQPPLIDEPGAAVSDQPTKKKKKFTGRIDESPNSTPPSPFARRSLFSESTSNTNRDDPRAIQQQRERQRELDLASRFEQTLPFQVILVIISFTFMIYVGATGGIARNSQEDSAAWDDMAQPNVVLPRGNDDEVDEFVQDYLDRIRSDTAPIVESEPSVGDDPIFKDGQKPPQSSSGKDSKDSVWI